MIRQQTKPMESNLEIEVVIVYENFAAGIRAKSMLDRLSAALQPEFGINRGLWKFELLDYPQLREQAAIEALKADMIVVSTNGDSDLPEHIKNWIESWLPQKREGLAALIALLDHPQQKTDSWPAYTYLRQVANEGKMDFFFCKTHDWEQPSEYAVDVADCPRKSISQPFAEVVGQGADWRGWGIND